jgi:hypothetical protein
MKNKFITSPGRVYSILSSLKIGDFIPNTIPVCNYTNGDIPPWKIAEIRYQGDGVILTVIDDNSPIFQLLHTDYPCTIILSFPHKTLCTPVHSYVNCSIRCLGDMLRQKRSRQNERIYDDE